MTDLFETDLAARFGDSAAVETAIQDRHTHAWWHVSGLTARTVCNQSCERKSGEPWPIAGTFDRAKADCPACLETLKAAGVGL